MQTQKEPLVVLGIWAISLTVKANKRKRALNVTVTARTRRSNKVLGMHAVVRRFLGGIRRKITGLGEKVNL